jgi:hypothetical protein
MHKLVNIPIYLLKNLRPDKLVGWLHVPVEMKRPTPEAEKKLWDTMVEARKMMDEWDAMDPQPVGMKHTITEGTNKMVHGKGVRRREWPNHLRLVAVDGKIIDPEFQN